MTKNQIIQQIKEILNVISFFEIREQTLRQELEFYIDKNDYVSKIDSYVLKRLEHEIMFLSVDTYSLHEGISKQKSFFKNTVKNSGKEIIKVDKKDTHCEDNIICIAIFDSDDKLPTNVTYEEKKDLLKECNKEAILSRNKIKEKVGIKSHTHQDIDQWIYENFYEDNDADLKNLSDYRKNFAHRLNSRDKLLNELKIHNTHELFNILNIVQKILNKYKNTLEDILLYISSIDFLGIKNLQYHSMDKIKYFIENKNN